MELKKRIKFLVLFYPQRSPAQVYRFEAFLKYLPKKSYDYEWVIDKEDEHTLYWGGLTKKLGLFVKMFFKTAYHLFSSRYKNVIINREVIQPGTIFFEVVLKKILRKKLIFDFDDAIWIPVISEGNKKYSFLKSYTKYAKIMKISDVVIAGNSFLADYARQFNSNVHIIPSCIDLDLYQKSALHENNSGKVCIGWSGSETTLAHLLTIKEILIEIQKKYGNKVYFKVISNRDNFEVEGLDIRSVKWSKEEEVNQLSEFDIGIMPLPDDEWSKGKCSMKGIQYMGLGIATIMSNIGMNKEVIVSGTNGLLANSDADWMSNIELLINNAELRNNLGAQGRKTIEEKYSVQVWKDTWIKLMTD